jgi:hypothetical protein
MEWQEWFELVETTAWPYELYGIYRVRITNPEGIPIPISRIGGIDPDGIMNIGRSGFRTSKTNRSLGQRLREFWYGNHSGAYTYGLALNALSRLPSFAGHRLWASIVLLSDDEIQHAEVAAIRQYFDRFQELPPYNGAFPGR